MRMASTTTYLSRPERKRLVPVRARKTYVFMGGYMTAGQIVGMFLVASLVALFLWAGIWLFAAVCFVMGWV